MSYSKKLQFVIFILLCLGSSKILYSKSLRINFSHQIGNEDLILNKLYSITPSLPLEINVLKYYVSQVQLVNHNRQVWKEENSFHLIDAFDSSCLSIELKHIPDNIDFDELQFMLGIDSATNDSASMRDALDPIHGMYWSWQSGYIHFKLEGKSEICNNPKNEFAFHIGGFLKPFETMQIVRVTLQNEIICSVKMDILPFISKLELVNENHIMQPCTQANELAKYFPKMFSAK